MPAPHCLNGSCRAHGALNDLLSIYEYTKKSICIVDPFSCWTQKLTSFFYKKNYSDGSLILLNSILIDRRFINAFNDFSVKCTRVRKNHIQTQFYDYPCKIGDVSESIQYLNVDLGVQTRSQLCKKCIKLVEELASLMLFDYSNFLRTLSFFTCAQPKIQISNGL